MRFPGRRGAARDASARDRARTPGGITDEQRAEWLASDPVDWANKSFAIARKPEVLWPWLTWQPSSWRPAGPPKSATPL